MSMAFFHLFSGLPRGSFPCRHPPCQSDEFFEFDKTNQPPYKDTMKSLAIFAAAAAIILALTAAGQTNALPIIYVHYGTGANDSPKRVVSSRIYLGETLFVASGDSAELRGHIEQRGTNIFADLTGDDGRQSDTYHGNITLEKPFWSQGGIISGYIEIDHWFVVSTNSDFHPLVGRVKEMFTNQPGFK